MGWVRVGLGKGGVGAAHGKVLIYPVKVVERWLLFVRWDCLLRFRERNWRPSCVFGEVREQRATSATDVRKVLGVVLVEKAPAGEKAREGGFGALTEPEP